MALFLMLVLCEGQETLDSKGHYRADFRETILGSGDLQYVSSCGNLDKIWGAYGEKRSSSGLCRHNYE